MRVARHVDTLLARAASDSLREAFITELSRLRTCTACCSDMITADHHDRMMLLRFPDLAFPSFGLPSEQRLPCGASSRRGCLESAMVKSFRLDSCQFVECG